MSTSLKSIIVYFCLGYSSRTRDIAKIHNYSVYSRFNNKTNNMYTCESIMGSSGDIPGRVAQSVTCLATDACLTADPGVASSIPARYHTFVEIDH